jgi:DNA-binding PadR family transcriptional regulator
MRPGQLALLRRIAVEPRTLHGMTHQSDAADMSLSPHTLSVYLDDLVLHDLITPPVKQHSYYTITPEGLAYLENLPKPTPSTLICGASMKAPYVPSVGYQRNDGLKHILSRGLGA